MQTMFEPCSNKVVSCQTKRDHWKFHRLILNLTILNLLNSSLTYSNQPQYTKLEVVQVGPKPNMSQSLEIGGQMIPLSESVKCPGVWWKYGLSASRAVSESISKARKVFLHWKIWVLFRESYVNPLSSSSIFVTCILPILLYGCKTWILDSSIITKLEQFQNEIGQRILQLPKHFSGKTVRLALQWPSMSTRVLIRKLKSLSRLLSDSNDVELISREIFSSLAIINVYGVSIIQQCRMLI